MRVVIVDERGAVSDDLSNEVMTRLLADNPSFTQREASVPDYDLNRRDYQIEELADTYPHRGVLRGPCLQFSDGGAVNDALKALSLVYPTLAFGMEYSGDDSDANLYHCLLQNGQYVRSQFDGASYLVPSICSPKTHFFDCLMPRSVAERARVKVLRARKVITDIADMLQSDHFVGDDMREGGDKMKTARVTTQLRAASNALAILDGLDFDDVIADDILDQPHFERSEKRIHDEETLNKQNELPLSEVREDDGIPMDWGGEAIMHYKKNL